MPDAYECNIVYLIKLTELCPMLSINGNHPHTTVAAAGADGAAPETPETEEAVADTPATAAGPREGDTC